MCPAVLSARLFCDRLARYIYRQQHFGTYAKSDLQKCLQELIPNSASMAVSPCPSDLRSIGFLKGKVATGSFRSWGVASTPTPTSLQASAASVNAILFHGQPLPPTSQDHVNSSVPRQRARLWSTCLWEACHPAVLHPGDTHTPTCEMRFLLPQHNIQVGRAEK